MKKYINKNKFGIVFNLSNANTKGSHWVSLFIDFEMRIVIYFDSNGDLPMEKVINGKLI